MIRQQQSGDLLIGRDDIAHFHAQHFQHAIRRRKDFHLPKLRVQFGQLRFGQRDALGPRAGQQQIVTAFGRGHGLLQGLFAGEGTITLDLGNGFGREEFFRPLAFESGEIELRDLRFPLGFAGGDFLFARPGFGFGELCGHLIALRVQLGGFEFNDPLTGQEGIAFLRPEFRNAPAIAGSHAGLIGFDRAGDGVGGRRGFAAGDTKGQSDGRNEGKGFGSHAPRA